MKNQQDKEENEGEQMIQAKSFRFQQNKYKANLKTILQVKFNPKDPKQQYYKETIEFVPNEAAIIKIGWKITDLEKSQEDLALKCFHLLSSQLLFPINIFTNLVQYDEETGQPCKSVKCLWMEQTMHTFMESKDLTYQMNNVAKVRIFEFAQNILLPRARSFMKNYLSWSAQIKNGHNEQTVVKLFFSKVIGEVNGWIKSISDNDKS